MNRTKAIQVAKVLKALIGISEVSIILDTFITSFRENSFEHDGTFYLCGNLKFGPQSGRLASSDPNLQNLPANSKYGKAVKSIIVAPDGWVFCGADENALEDRVGAILSGDENKTKEFSQGFDGHSLRAHAFYSPRIHPELRKYDPNDPVSINLIATEHPKWRQDAKTPSFALQYGGTAYTLVKNIGLSDEDAASIEESYKSLYAGIEEFARLNIEHAIDTGFVECAFGLRLRTPALGSLPNTSCYRPYDCVSEGRSANNAVTQSWGLLINRSLIATEERIRRSAYANDIIMCNTIHDAAYFLARKDAETIHWLNQNLIPEMSWQQHPKIQSTDVPLGAELDIGKSWDKMHTIPNDASVEDIETLLGNI